jgi:hypothetical protein
MQKDKTKNVVIGAIFLHQLDNCGQKAFLFMFLQIEGIAILQMKWNGPHFTLPMPLVFKPLLLCCCLIKAAKKKM